jgi:hypothetical protein
MLPVLHPRHKLQYFKNAGWDDDWVETAYGMVRDIFNNAYKNSPGVKPNKPNIVDSVRVQFVL